MPGKRYSREKKSPSVKKGKTPRRRVPLYVTLSVLFMNYWALLGIIALSIGFLIVSALAPLVDFVTPFHFGEEALSAHGTLVEKRGTGISIEKRSLTEYHFSYSYMGRSYTGVSYSTLNLYNVKDSVPVEVDPENPLIARIADMDIKPLHFVFSIFLILFSLPGLALLGYTFYKRVPYITVMKYGVMTRGRFIKMEKTGNVVNKKVMYEVFFSFNSASGGKYTSTGTTFNTDAVKDEREERIVYDPANPSNSFIVDAMPSVVRRFFSAIPG